MNFSIPRTIAISIVLIHRKGILPYIPVTRKQYLEQCISYHTKIWDENIKE